MRALNSSGGWSPFLGRKMSRLVVPFLLLLVGASSCLAGGSGWSVKVEQLEFKSSGEFSLRVVPEAGAQNFPRECAALTVTGHYASVRWFFLGSEEMTSKNHMAALRFLSSQVDGGTLPFGEIGDGLAMDARGMCRASSRGLMLVSEGGVAGVYSYYKWP